MVSADEGRSSASLEKHKIVFLGDSCVGKTSIITRFMYDTFELGYQSTIGIDFLSKTVMVGERMVRLQLWDTAGQERFKSLIPSYIRDSKVAVVVYDITNRVSFDSVEGWVDSVRSERGDEISVVIIGNKTDKSHDSRDVSVEEGKAKADILSASFLETSAQTGQNITNLFSSIASTLPGASRPSHSPAQSDSPYHSQPHPSAIDPFTVQPSPAVRPQKSSCGGCA
eukprot:TRINITY_DN1773_c0_g1_i5.p1 TRINITY_DN1773_c0_g1~~TRINITY_DN1773_c0_g1_i5.p1  ORF type:complete len:246 (+),score=27.86 TRINITY_DN1773_c0_g1_i5:63-740(+)